MYDNAKYHREKRAALGASAIGSERPCLDCGTAFIYRNGAQKHCTSCQKAKRRKYNEDYNRRFPEKAKVRTLRAKNRHEFGGNRDACLIRDNYACQLCESTDRPHVHHKDGGGVTSPKAERNHAMSNLVTLCHSCHSRVHMIARKEAARISLLHAWDVLSAEAEAKKRAHAA